MWGVLFLSYFFMACTKVTLPTANRTQHVGFTVVPCPSQSSHIFSSFLLVSATAGRPVLSGLLSFSYCQCLISGRTMHLLLLALELLWVCMVDTRLTHLSAMRVWRNQHSVTGTGMWWFNVSPFHSLGSSFKVCSKHHLEGPGRIEHLWPAVLVN